MNIVDAYSYTYTNLKVGDTISITGVTNGNESILKRVGLHLNKEYTICTIRKCPFGWCDDCDHKDTIIKIARPCGGTTAVCGMILSNKRGIKII